MIFSLNRYIIAISILSIIFCSCGNQKGIIPAGDMSKIIAEMYLSDQYIETTPGLRVQADTMALYRPIIEQYGYSVDNYIKSTTYYLAKGNAYKKIHIKALNLLEKRKLNISHSQTYSNITAEDIELKSWWATDTVTLMQNDRLQYFPYLRTIRWIVLPYLPIKEVIRYTDTIDAPGNSIWWENFLSYKKPPEIKSPYINTDTYILRSHRRFIQNDYINIDPEKLIMERIRKEHLGH